MKFPLHWRWLALTAGAALLLLFTYGSVLTSGPFGINDDYQYLYRVHVGTFDPAHNEQTGMGRPVASWGFEIAYGLCDGKVARLVWLRAFALAGVGLFAWTLFRTLLGLRYSPVFAGTVAAVVAFSPACGVYAAWTAAMFSPYALTMALLAGILLNGRTNWRRDAAGGLLLVVACTVWQAAAPLALFPTLAQAWQSPDTTDRKRWWRPWLVCGLAVVFYAALCWLTLRSGMVSAADTERLTLATDLPSKIRLFGNLLRSGVTSWARLQPGFWEWTVGSLTVGACLGAFVDREDGRVQWVTVRRRAGLAAVLLLLSISPLLAARENNAAFRSLPVLYLVVAFLGVGGLERFLRGKSATFRGGMSLAVVTVCAGAARYHVWHGLVSPNVREYVGLRDQVRTQFPAGSPGRLVYLLPPPTLLAAGRLPPSWEYGLVSSSFWWVTRPFLLLLFEETASDPSKPPELTILYREARHPGVPVLDPLPVLLREPGAWRDDPRWGRVRVFSRGWLYSPWFGYFNVERFPVIQHHLLGSLLFTSQAKDGNDLWFYHEPLGQFFTNAEAFPYVFVGSSNRWMILSDDDPARVQLDDPATGERIPYPH